MRPAVLVLVTACGRVGFDPTTNVWSQGELTLEPPTPMTELNTAAVESECFVRGDRMYYARTSTTSAHDIWTATRTGSDAPFTNPVLVPAISTSSAEGRLVTGDGLHWYFWSCRPGSSGADIWNVNGELANANAHVVAGLDSGVSEYDPWPTPDNSRLYFMMFASVKQIYVVDLLAPDVASAPRLIGVESGNGEDNPALTSDERFIVFASDRRGGAGGSDLWYARRSDRDAPFGPAQPLPVVNSPAMDSEPCITDEGELFFSSDRGGNVDLYQSRFIVK